MYKKFETELAGRKLEVETGKVAELANGNVIVRYGDTVVMVNVTASKEPREGIDFFPLSVDYEEKLYAVGKIPGSFQKREGKPADKAILTSRAIDRPIRPLFPKDFRNDVCVVATVLSVEQDNSPEVCAMIGTAAALAISDIPFGVPTAAVNVGYVDNQIVINPTVEQREKSRLNLTVAGTMEKVTMIEAGADEIPNDTMLDKDENRLSIITGPNMAGKSTYMRQVALITLMAQVGSFVPAEQAHIGVVDKIFTRVGASDDLSMGQSTFMVEMMEVATILKEATSNSLVILDEIGRGTSTYDGLSIALAVVEHITDKTKCGAKTLFATHYHELTELENKIEGVKNYSIAVKEKGEDIIFLRKIIRGGTDESYGIHVAKLAGVPKTVVKRSNEILRSLERKNMLGQKKQENKKQPEGQLDFYNYKLAEIAHEIDKINLNELTPIDALNTLMKMKEKMQ